MNLRKAIICPIHWLSTYICHEHFYLINLLYELHGFDIIDINFIKFDDSNVIRRLNRYDAILLAYQGEIEVYLDNVTAYKIFKIDDLVSYSENYDRIANSIIASSNTVIGPVAYEFSKHFKHDDIVWVPYSCGIEDCLGGREVAFNLSPVRKILVSGSIAPDRPFRRYAAELQADYVDVLPHPGYGGRYDDSSKAIVRYRYYEELSKYLCCFSDAHTYRYIHLKNFEIAAVGSLLLADRLVEKEMNQLGFVDYKTCIFTSKNDFLDKAAWILDEKNAAEIEKIRRAGMALVWERHLTKHRALQIDGLVVDRVLGKGVGTRRLTNSERQTRA